MKKVYVYCCLLVMLFTGCGKTKAVSVAPYPNWQAFSTNDFMLHLPPTWQGGSGDELAETIEILREHRSIAL